MKRTILSIVIFFLSYPLVLNANYLKIYAYPNNHKVNWKSPRTLAMTALRSSLKGGPFTTNYSIGHVNIELYCQNNKEVILTGMGSNIFKPKKLKKIILKDKLGLGLLFHNFPGKIIPKDQILLNNKERLPKGKVAWIKWKISPSTCSRLSEYYRQYIDLRHYLNYGLSNRPLYREGGGCSAFGMSFVELAGLMEKEFIKNWSRNIKVGKDLIGGPITNKNVSIFKLFLSPKAKQWDTKGDGLNLFFWEPQLMFDWIEKIAKSPKNSNWEIEREGNSIGLYKDASSIPTPSSSIWKN